ncbi:NAD(P)H-hydrate epimerase [Nannocystis pusilla]|uniref:NAD(P)H-hydrate epimerase n=1 Tax=Nannocystis pusilla TaxID=889268 RepID=UPI003B76CC5A
MGGGAGAGVPAERTPEPGAGPAGGAGGEAGGADRARAAAGASGGADRRRDARDGAAPPLRQPFVAAVAWANARSGPKLAIDIPTGLDADTGAASGPVFAADRTVTFVRSKPGLHVTPGRAAAGEVVVADIGIVSQDMSDETCLIDPGEVARSIAGLKPGSHKGSAGTSGSSAARRGRRGRRCWPERRRCGPGRGW